MKKNIFKTGQLLVQLGNTVTWLRNSKMYDKGLTSSQSGTIYYLLKHQNEKITAVDLTEKLFLSKSTVSEIIQTLEQKDFLKRYGTDDDGRKKIIEPTEKSIELKKDLENVIDQTEHILLKGMSTHEREQFSRLLETALKNIDAYKATMSVMQHDAQSEYLCPEREQ